MSETSPLLLRNLLLQAVLLGSSRPITKAELEGPSVYLLNLIQSDSIESIRLCWTSKYQVIFADIPIAHRVEPRPEVWVKMYDLVAQIQTEIVEVRRLYEDADIVRGMS